MSVDAESLKKTMRMWVSGVTVVTAVHGQKRAGATVSSFTSISVEPPMILISLQHYIETFKVIEASGYFAVSILRNDQVHLSRQFAGASELPEGADKFHEVNLMNAVTGVPILAEAAAWVDCKLVAIYEAGSSRIVVGEVLATGQQEEATPLAYRNRGYYNLAPQE